MNSRRELKNACAAIFFIASMVMSACASPAEDKSPVTATSPTVQIEAGNVLPESTPFPTRPAYTPGQLVDYTAQTGDTLPALALRFNTSVDEILAANTFIPRDATTMPPGMPIRMPIYYRALWNTPFQSIPDHAYLNSPTSVGFNTAAFLSAQPGWLKNYRAYVGGEWKTGAAIVDYIAVNYSISPRLILALLEYQGGALTQTEPPVQKNLLGFKRAFWESPYLQLVIAANTLNNGYYGWRTGSLLEFEDTSGVLIRPDPWQNAGSAALQYYFAQMMTGSEYDQAIGADGLAKTYMLFFGNPWESAFEVIPGSLQQPELFLPFPASQTWSFTGGPHTGWGTGFPLSALDFAPPAERSGCVPAKYENYATAAADGLIVRSGQDGVALDLDKDGDERTGWVIYYLHLATDARATVGSDLRAGDKIGYPSCEGGRSTGTHVHVARKYNGEWLPAEGPLPFVMSGWIPRNGASPYEGTLNKGGRTVIACTCSDAFAAISGSYP